MAYDRLSPLDRQEHLLGQLLTLFANVYRDQKRPAYRLDDFLPSPHRNSPEEERRIIADTMGKMAAALQERGKWHPRQRRN